MKKRKTHQKGYERQPPIFGEDHREILEPPRVDFDIEKYRPYLGDEDLSHEQATELLLALWQIMTSFVELGFNVHPVQQACGQVSHTKAFDPSDARNALHSSIQSFVSEFENSADAGAGEETI